MITRPLDRAGLCVCGLSVALHFDSQNRKLTCDELKAWLARCDRGDLDPSRAPSPVTA